MQLFINNWSSALTLPATAAAEQLSVAEADAALLVGLGTGDHYLLTLAIRDINGLETAWEIVRVTGVTGGVLDVVREQEGTTALELEAGVSIIARLTKDSLETLQVAIAAQQAALAGKAPLAGLPRKLVDATTYTITPADAGFLIVFTAATAVAVTVAAESAGAWPDADVHMLQKGLGKPSVVGDGFTINTSDGLLNAIEGQYGMSSLARFGPDDWVHYGMLEAAP